MRDPLAHLFERWPFLVVHEHIPLPGKTRGWTNGRVLLLRPGLCHTHRTDTAVHEGHHLERGATPTGTHQAREERIVRRLTARTLVPLPNLVDAVKWTRNPWELAWELGVTRRTLWTRLTTLTMRERAAVTDALPDGTCLHMTNPAKSKHQPECRCDLPDDWGEEPQYHPDED